MPDFAPSSSVSLTPDSELDSLTAHSVPAGNTFGGDSLTVDSGLDSLTGHSVPAENTYNDRDSLTVDSGLDSLTSTACLSL